MAKYETLEDLQRAEEEIKEVDHLIEQESDTMIKAALQETAVAMGAGGVGVLGGGAALFFAGIVGFSGAGITSGLAAIGAIVGGGMLAGMAVLAAAPFVLAGGGYLATRYYRQRKFNEARQQLRQHATARRDFLKKLVDDNADKADKLAEYRLHLNRLTTMIEALG